MISVDPTTEHPFASVTVTEYVPLHKPERLDVVAPVFHEYEYGAVPLPATAVAVPVHGALHIYVVLLTNTVGTGLIITHGLLDSPAVQSSHPALLEQRKKYLVVHNS